MSSEELESITLVCRVYRENLLELLGNVPLIGGELLQLSRSHWCGGWDLNPRRPTPADLKSAPFVQARAPPHRVIVVLFRWL